LQLQTLNYEAHGLASCSIFGASDFPTEMVVKFFGTATALAQLVNEKYPSHY
jgi:hypothetical protein